MEYNIISDLNLLCFNFNKDQSLLIPDLDNFCTTKIYKELVKIVKDLENKGIPYEIQDNFHIEVK
ncbi:MAG: hypothetical protein U9Q04_08080 [Campylobacterota bacterium]|nr:hypothetical protein [Campylobacterota bacterium]